MKLTTPEIVWHGKEPVFSADFHHCGEILRLATGGADKDVKIWKIVKEEKKVKVVIMASLSRHSGAINVVRFSPNGELLASAGDDNVVCLWKLGEGGGAGNNIAMDTTPNEENWTVTKMLKGHLEDIYDACWSANSSLLVTGSVDNTAIVWDINKGQSLCVLKESRQYVQGVAWDPIGQYLATLSSDRYLRIYSADQKYKCVHTIGKMTAPEQERGTGTKPFRMWIDESLSFFFRRLSFSPDGNLLIAPAGRFENGDKVSNMTYIFTKNSLTKPVVCLPGPGKATVVVKFCPRLFQLRDTIEKEKCLFSLPYRMVYAVASLDAVLLYDTQQTTPFAYLSNIHYSGITDLAWSDDGLVLMVTSSDAYCSIVTFEPGELGVALPAEEYPSSMRPSVTESHTSKGTGTVDTKKLADETKATIIPRTSDTENDITSTEGVIGGDVMTETHKEREMEGETKPSERAEPTGAGVREEAAVGVKKDAKGKRRIRTTLVEPFSTPSLEKTPPSSATASKPQPETENILSQDTVTAVDSSKRESLTNCETEDITSSQSMTESPAQEKKPRRVQLVRLSSLPPLSHDSESQSHDQDSTHLCNPAQPPLVDSTCTDKVEIME